MIGTRIPAALILFFLPSCLFGADLHRASPLLVSAGGNSGFTLIAPQATRVNFTNRLSDNRSLTNQIYLNGSGVAAGDVDGDGFCDLYFCGLDNRNELYRNLGGWRFESITSAARVACEDQASTGAALADLDGDGDLDLLVNGIARGTRLFLNDGKAQFTEATEQFGVGAATGAMSMALADIDGDGFLDLYVVNYRIGTFRDEPEKRFRVSNKDGRFELLTVDGRPASDPSLLGRFTVDPATGLVEHGEADALFRNLGGKKFERVSWTNGAFLDEKGQRASIPYDWGLSAMFRDVNRDGAPDLYVCNDFQSDDRLWINDGIGIFRLIRKAALRQTSLFSMGVDFADLDHDGRDEIFVADMLSREHTRRQTQVLSQRPASQFQATQEERPQYSRNTLFWGRADGTYAEIAQLSGLHASEWSWCPAFIDVDLDGHEDLVITAGHARDAQNIDVAREIELAKSKKPLSWREQMEMRRRFPKLETPLIAFRNQGDLTFAYASPDWGFTMPHVAQGLALADLDNDGDLDLIANALNEPALLYRNNSSSPRLAVRLKGASPNTGGIGARIEVFDGAVPVQSQEMMAGGRYLSSDDAIRTFAAGNSTNLRVRVRWRNGRETIIRDLRPNTILEIAELHSDVPQPAAPTNVAPIFRDISSMLSHRHQDQPFDDFQRQPLLPRSFGSLGPGITWFDVDGDGWEDLLIGSGRTGRIAFFKNENGTLKQIEIPGLCAPGTRDRTTIIGLPSPLPSEGRGQGEGRPLPHTRLLVGSANYEDGLTNGPSVRQFSWGATAMDDHFPGFPGSTGPLAAADFDRDGDLDLFVGGRIIAARYPLPASSAFFRSNDGTFAFDEPMSRAFAKVGLVSAALFSDLTGDGAPELLLACDGGPIRVFSFTNLQVKEITADLGLNQWIGYWNSLAAGDFNADGRMDIVAGNWGRNTKYQSYLPSANHLFYSDTKDTSFVPILEAYRDPTLNKVVPLHDLETLAGVFPELKQRYPTFAAFSTAAVSELPRFKDFRDLQINTLDSMLFLNTGAKLLPRVLPLQAQVAPVFGIAVGDIDADGHTDLFLAQNFFRVGKNTSRHDAGQGLLLRGDGNGEFEPLSAPRAGIEIVGEGRGTAFCDFNHDGRLDLAVAQNADGTKLYSNEHPKAGLRVVLKGASANPNAVGATVRLIYTDGTFGPLVEVHTGEGYWSQAGGALVLGSARPARAIEVRWPGGSRQIAPIPSNAQEVLVTKM